MSDNHNLGETRWLLPCATCHPLKRCFFSNCNNITVCNIFSKQAYKKLQIGIFEKRPKNLSNHYIAK